VFCPVSLLQFLNCLFQYPGLCLYIYSLGTFEFWLGSSPSLSPVFRLPLHGFSSQFISETLHMVAKKIQCFFSSRSLFITFSSTFFKNLCPLQALFFLWFLNLVWKKDLLLSQFIFFLINTKIQKFEEFLTHVYSALVTSHK
jgi:hypothetical protein